MDKPVIRNQKIPKISAIVLTYNEEKQIKDCLETIKWVDEIIIVDSFSTDNTLEICQNYTNKIYQRQLDGFSNQRNWALEKASFEWILVVDCDERYTPELRAEIKASLEGSEDYDGYYFRMSLYVFGKELKGEYWKERRIKLFKKEKGRWTDKLVHEYFLFKGKTRELKNPIHHYAYPDIKTYLKKFNSYTSWETKEMARNKVRVKWYDLFKSLLRPALFFYRVYILKKGFQDGLIGLIWITMISPYYLVADIKYWRLKRKIYEN